MALFPSGSGSSHRPPTRAASRTICGFSLISPAINGVKPRAPTRLTLGTAIDQRSGKRHDARRRDQKQPTHAASIDGLEVGAGREQGVKHGRLGVLAGEQKWRVAVRVAAIDRVAGGDSVVNGRQVADTTRRDADQ